MIFDADQVNRIVNKLSDIDFTLGVIAFCMILRCMGCGR
jgi:hypothetical protein